MRVLVSHEKSGTVRDEFIKRGHDAISCDLKPTEKPGPHYQGSVYDILFRYKWDLIIAHTECTKICVSGNHVYAKGKPKYAERLEAVEWTYRLWQHCIALCGKVCFENPVGVLPSLTDMPKPAYVQPYEFGHDASKKTGLYLHNLPPLVPTGRTKGRIVNGVERWANQTDSGQNRLGPSEDRAAIRSLTYEGIAELWQPSGGCYDT